MSYTLVSGQEGEGYTPYGETREFFYARDPEAILVGPSDTGKTLCSCWKMHILACKYPGAQLAMVRKTFHSINGSVLKTYQKKVLGNDSPVKPYGGERPEWFDYPNGSRIWLGGMDNPDKVLSSERDVIYVNQAEELALQDWEILGTRCSGRAGNMPYAQLIGDCNPGSPMHWIKARANAGKLKLFNSSHRDNPEIYDPKTGMITEGGQKRLRVLENLSGARLLRLFRGLWVAPEGAIYDVFDETRHKVKAFTPPSIWPRAVGIDPFGARVAALWLAFDPASNILNVYREYYEPFGLTTPGHVKNILELSKGESIFSWVGGGPSERQARLDWQAAGIPMTAPPITDVWMGIDRVIQLLRDFKLVIHDSCINLLSEIGSYQRKVINGEPSEIIEGKENFHMLDCLRYIIAYLTEPTEQTHVRYNPVQIGPDY